MRFVKFDVVFAPLRDPIEFNKARVHPELGVVYWPNGADLDSGVLYAKITGAAIAPQTSCNPVRRLPL
jgi:hypothetical protein